MNTVDLFAGLGGSSEGARAAGCNVIWAGNHWGLAVDTHALNHPGAQHICQDLQQADWSAVPAHDLMLASPCCQGHSHAKGKGRSDHDASRSTAWAPISCLEHHRPEFFIIENVPEFTGWRLYKPWSMCLSAMGYSTQIVITDSADAGVAQHRRRLFIIGNRGRTAIDLDVEKIQHVTARDVIDFNAGNWTEINKPGRAKATLSRIKNGREAHGDQFIAPYYGSGSGQTGRSLDRPIGTITTKARWSVINGNMMRMLTIDETKKFMGFPMDYMIPTRTKSDAIKLLGNAVVPPDIARHIDALKRAA